MINFILRIFASHAAVSISKLLQRHPGDWAFTEDNKTHTMSDGSKITVKLYFLVHKSELFAVSLLKSDRENVGNFHIPNTPPVMPGRIDSILLARAISNYLSLPDAGQSSQQGVAEQA